MSSDRPDPDSILKMIKDEEKKSNRGKLTIFLGYSAGVGKTYAMLESAKRQKKSGKDVVIGIIETHGRKETENLVEGLEKIEPTSIEYKNITLTELNIDRLLERAPDIALVDELAHTNVPGSRNLKRYQDIYEILNSGIDVYTTLNIQHIESMNSTVEQITKIKVTETLPDTILNEADDIKLVDLPPKDLLLRFQEGKIFIPEQAHIAMRNFFNEGNLMALRELSFRAAAEHVDEKMMEYMRSNFLDGEWKIKEKILVCIGDSKELNEKLINTGKKHAEETKTEWEVMYVECRTYRHSGTISEEAMKSLELAKSLGAKTNTVHGTSIIDAILKYAKVTLATRIIVGNAIFSQKIDILNNSLVKKLTKTPLNADIIIVTISKDEKESVLDYKNEKSPDEHLRPSMMKQIIIATVIASLTLILNRFLFSENEEYWIFILMIAIFSIIICSIFMDIWPSIYAAALTIVLTDIFIIYPLGTIWIYDPIDTVSLLILMPIAIIVCLLSIRIRNRYIVFERRYKFVSTQYDVTRDLCTAETIEGVFDSLERNLNETYGIRSIFYLKNNDDIRLVMMSEKVTITAKDMMAAKWTMHNKTMSGRYTDTLSSVDMKYFPMCSSKSIIGVGGFMLDDDDISKRIEQEKIIQTSLLIAAKTVERIHSTESARNNYDQLI